MRVTVLGRSGSYPGRGGATSGYLVDDGRTRVWLDCGSGTLARLQEHLADLATLDAIVVSHEHPDHWTDLEGFHNVLRFVLGRQRLPVYAPVGVREHTYDDMAPWVQWHDTADGDKATIGSLGLTFSRTDHGPETLAVRVDSAATGRSLGYSADTGPEWSLAELGDGLDLALCEATVPQEREGEMQHLSARQAGESGKEAGVRRLVLTHLWPTLDAEQSRAEGTAAFGRPVEVATIGRSWDL